MQNVIEIRNMHTAIHELFLLERKPITTLDAFRALSKGLDYKDENENWRIIHNNTSFLGEINFRDITESRQIIHKGIKYNILNNHAYDIYS